MPRRPWPSIEALRLLRDLEVDPYEREWIELSRTLNAWEVTDVVREEWNFVVRAHPDASDFEFGYNKGPGTLNPETVRRFCERIRTLHERLDP